MLEVRNSLIDDLKAETPEPTKSVSQLIQEALVPQGVDIPKPDLVFGLSDVPVFTKKSLSVLKGPAKVGKTTVTAWITAQVINSQINVLWLDTEQGMYYASRTQSWVLRIAQVERSPYLNMYELKIHNPNKRIEMIEQLIGSEMFDLIIIDGIRDLVFDINNPEEATNITGNLMRWADAHDCHILSIIHQNKGSDHARGHLGTELINKSETVIKVSKDDAGIVICEPEFTRGIPFEPFGFDRDAYGIPQLCTVTKSINVGESNNKKLSPTDIPKSQHMEYLRHVFPDVSAVSYGDLQSGIAAAFGHFGVDLGVNKVKVFIAWYVQNGLLLKGEKIANKVFYTLNDE